MFYSGQRIDEYAPVHVDNERTRSQRGILTIHRRAIGGLRQVQEKLATGNSGAAGASNESTATLLWLSLVVVSEIGPGIPSAANAGLQCKHLRQPFDCVQGRL